MQAAVDVKRKLEGAFPKKQASVLAEVITDAYSELVKTSDFNELKGIVKELAEAQNRTEEFLGAELIPVLLTYAVHPKVEQYATDKGLKLYWFYDLAQQRTVA